MHRVGWMSAVVVVSILTGCSAAPSLVRASHDSAFDSSAQALASARTAFTHYLDVRDQITADGGSGVERLAALVTPRQFEVEQAQSDLLRLGRYTTTGTTSFDEVTLAEEFDYGVGVASVTMRVCLDTTNVRTVDYRGWDVSPPAPRRLTEVTFVTASTPPFALLLEEVVPCEPAPC